MKEVRIINMITSIKLWKPLFWAVLLVFPVYFSAEGPEIDEDQLRLLDALPPDQKGRVLEKMQLATDLEGEIESAFGSAPTALKRPKEKVLTEKEEREYKIKSRNWVYGYELFDQSPTTFVSGTENIPVPEDYLLGPGDKIKIELFGGKTTKVSQFINRSGSISIPNVGPITIAGLTISDAKDFITKKVSEALTGTEVFLSLGEFRSINIFILGSAIVGIAGAMMVTNDGLFTPGSYRPMRYTFLIWVMVIIGGSGNNFGAILGGFAVWFLWIEAAPIALFLINLFTAGLAETNALKLHLINSVPYFRFLMMGTGLLLIMRYRPKGILPEKIIKN